MTVRSTVVFMIGGVALTHASCTALLGEEFEGYEPRPGPADSGVEADVSFDGTGGGDAGETGSPDVGQGGTGGTAGGAGAAGFGGIAGASGSAGQAGGAGSAGAAGAGGSAGDAGAGGSAGQAGWAGSAGDAGTAGSAGGDQDAGPDAPLCSDPYPEPNESESAATSLGTIDDCTASGGVVSGVLGPSDIDWFVFNGQHPALGSCSPGAYASVGTTGLRLCAFLECKSGTTSVSCLEGGSATSPFGRQGCCSGTGVVAANHTCSGLGGTNATVFLRVDDTAGTACTQYELTYHY